MYRSLSVGVGKPSHFETEALLLCMCDQVTQSWLERAQWLEVPAAFSEGLCLVLSTCVVTHNVYNYSFRDLTPFSGLHGHCVHVVQVHTGRQNIIGIK